MATRNLILSLSFIVVTQVTYGRDTFDIAHTVTNPSHNEAELENKNLARSKLIDSLSPRLRVYAARTPTGGFELSDQEANEIKQQIKESLGLPAATEIKIQARGSSALIGKTLIVLTAGTIYYVNTDSGGVTAVPHAEINANVYHEENGIPYVITSYTDQREPIPEGESRYTFNRKRFLVNGTPVSYSKGFARARLGLTKATLKSDRDLIFEFDPVANVVKVNGQIAHPIN